MRAAGHRSSGRSVSTASPSAFIVITRRRHSSKIHFPNAVSPACPGRIRHQTSICTSRCSPCSTSAVFVSPTRIAHRGPSTSHLRYPDSRLGIRSLYTPAPAPCSSHPAHSDSPISVVNLLRGSISAIQRNHLSPPHPSPPSAQPAAARSVNQSRSRRSLIPRRRDHIDLVLVRHERVNRSLAVCPSRTRPSAHASSLHSLVPSPTPLLSFSSIPSLAQVTLTRHSQHIGANKMPPGKGWHSVFALRLVVELQTELNLSSRIG